MVLLKTSNTWTIRMTCWWHGSTVICWLSEWIAIISRVGIDDRLMCSIWVACRWEGSMKWRLSIMSIVIALWKGLWLMEMSIKGKVLRESGPTPRGKWLLHYVPIWWHRIQMWVVEWNVWIFAKVISMVFTLNATLHLCTWVIKTRWAWCLLVVVHFHRLLLKKTWTGHSTRSRTTLAPGGRSSKFWICCFACGGKVSGSSWWNYGRLNLISTSIGWWV